MEDNMTFIAVRPSKEIYSLYKLVADLDCTQDMDRNAITERALRYVDSLDTDDFGRKMKQASRLQIELHELELPSSFKVKEPKDLVKGVVEKFKNAFGISKVRWLFFLKVILAAYYTHLQEEEHDISSVIEESEEEEGINNLMRFYTSVEVSEMFLRNMPEDEEYIEGIVEIMNRRAKERSGI